MGSNAPGFTLRKLMARTAAIERGVELGRARQRPSPEEIAAHRALGIEEHLWRGHARGRALEIRLQQERLQFPDADGS